MVNIMSKFCSVWSTNDDEDEETNMKVKIKEVTIYEYSYSLQFEMREKGKVFINPYLVTIGLIESHRMGTERKDFVTLYQQGKGYTVLLEDIEDIIEIC